MLAAETLPYSVVNSFAFSPTCCTMARRSLRSSSSRPWSSAILNTSCSTPSCVSLRPSRRASSSGPMSETVARTGWPLSPKTSQNTTGLAAGAQSVMPSLSRRAASLSDLTAGRAEAGEVALDVGEEHRHADGGELLGQALQGHGLAGAGGAGDQAVAIGQRGQQAEFQVGCVLAMGSGRLMVVGGGEGGEDGRGGC